MANFINLTSNEQLNELIESSKSAPVILFKHSTTCPISASVYQEVSKVDADVNLIVVQTSRNVALEIAEKFDIRHESPQALVVKDGQAIYHASHFDIAADDITAAIE